MGEGIYTRRKRFTFVEKTAGEVGARTAYPMRATPGQIAEVMYRVRDAWFTGGDAFWDYGGSTMNISVIGSLTVGYPFAMSLASDSFIERSYALQRDSTWDNAAHYFLDGYANPTGNASSYDTAFEIGDSERALFAEDNESLTDFPFNGINTICPAALDSSPGPIVIAGFDYETYTFRCAFNHLHYHASITAPDPYGIVGYPDGDPAQAGETYTSLVFSGEVAWVDVNGSGNPLDPLNELYLGLNLGIELFGMTTLTTRSALWDELGCDFVIQLAGGDSIRCPLYYDSTSVGSVDTASDFVITAKEWFPYAAGIPAAPVWDTATGARL